MDKYNRNILIEGFGEEGQAKLTAAKVLVVGGGGLGSPVLLYLAAAGVGTLGIIDCDEVDETNLQRQIIHFASDVGTHKVASARQKLHALNPEVAIITYPERLTAANAAARFADFDFIVDCSDNYDTKYLIDDVCVQLGKPYSHGSVVAMRGEAMTYVPGCATYRSVFGNSPSDADAITSSRVGILGAVAGMIGSIQATETIKYLTGVGELLTNRLLVVDGRTMQFLTYKLQ